MRDGKAHGAPASDIFDDIGTMIGRMGPGLLTRPLPPPGPMAETTAAVRRSLAEEIQARRHLIGDDPTIEEWACAIRRR